MPGIINRGDLGGRLKDGLALKGPTPVATVTPELTPVVILEDLREPDVRSQGVTVRLCSAGVYTGVFGAGNFSQTKLANPAGSGWIIRLRRVQTSLTNVASGTFVSLFRVANATALSGGVFQQGALNNFRLPDVLCCGQVSEGQTAVVPAPPFLCRWRQPPDFPQHQDVDIVIPPGLSVILHPEVSNLQMHSSWWWEELPIEMHP